MRQIALGLFLLMMIAGCRSYSAAADASVTILQRWSGQESGIGSFSTSVVNDAKGWTELWKRIGREPPLVFDASKTTAVAVFIGQRNTGGYSAEITRAYYADTYLRVEYHENRPSADTRVAQVITTPWVIALISGATTQVQFVSVPSSRSR
jgi:hypothetical protein